MTHKTDKLGFGYYQSKNEIPLDTAEESLKAKINYTSYKIHIHLYSWWMVSSQTVFAESGQDWGSLLSSAMLERHISIQKDTH